jgi:translocation protein SEC72
MSARRNDLFIQLPLSVDEKTLAVEAAGPAASIPDLDERLAELNALHKSLKSVPGGIPPPPVPVPPQRSAAIEKMRVAGNTAFRKGNYNEAISMYTHAISMALTRPHWEPAPLLKEELQVLYSNRAQAHMSVNNWPEALADVSLSVDMKKVQNSKAHWRKAKSLKEMGRLEEAKDALEHGLEFGPDSDLQTLLKDVNVDLAARK